MSLIDKFLIKNIVYADSLSDDCIRNGYAQTSTPFVIRNMSLRNMRLQSGENEEAFKKHRRLSFE